MSNDSNKSKNENMLYAFILSHKKVVVVISAVVCFGIVLAFCAAQTRNYHKTLSLYNDESGKNLQLGEQLGQNESTIAFLEELIETNRQVMVEIVEKQVAEIAEWQDLYYKASYEDSHVKYALRLYDMDGPLFVPSDIEQGLIDFLKNILGLGTQVT